MWGTWTVSTGPSLEIPDHQEEDNIFPMEEGSFLSEPSHSAGQRGYKKGLHKAQSWKPALWLSSQAPKPQQNKP